MKFTVPPRLAHHGLKTLALLVPLMVATIVYDDAHWAVYVASFFVSVAFVFVGVASGRHVDGCRYCPARTQADLTRPRFRIALAVGRLAWLPPAIVALFLLIAPLITDPGKSDSPSHRGALIATGYIWLTLATFAAWAFRRRTRHLRPDTPATPTTERLRRHAEALAHKSHILLGLSVAAYFPFAYLNPETGPWAVMQSAVLLALVVCFIGVRRHSSRLCTECVTSFRIDAAEYAASKQWVFTIYHRTGPVLFAVVLLLFVGSLAPGVWGNVAGALVFASWAATLPIDRFHQAYQPWCPQCRRWGRGDDPVEVPDPTSGHGKPVPA